MAWIAVPDDFLTLMPEKDLIAYTTLSGASTAEINDEVLTNLAVKAQEEVEGVLAPQGSLPSTLPVGNPSTTLLRNVTLALAFERLFMRISGQAAELPPAWRDHISRQHKLLESLRTNTLKLDPAVFDREDFVESPQHFSTYGSNTTIDKAFSNERFLQ